MKENFYITGYFFSQGFQKEFLKEFVESILDLSEFSLSQFRFESSPRVAHIPYQILSYAL